MMSAIVCAGSSCRRSTPRISAPSAGDNGFTTIEELFPGTVSAAASDMAAVSSLRMHSVRRSHDYCYSLDNELTRNGDRHGAITPRIYAVGRRRCRIAGDVADRN